MSQKKQKGTAYDEQRRRRSIQLKLTLFAFMIIVLSCVMTVLGYLLLLMIFSLAGMRELITLNPILVAILLLCTCGIIATVMFAWLSRVYLRPLQLLIDATKEVKKGNFEVHVHHKERHPVSEMEELVNNFNDMVRELGSIEMFRNDFINNFSHEFKTPIVSIRGFAKEMQYPDVTEAQKQEYARIIEDESDRLAKLASNISELSKLEHQQIVTNRADFYLDEQIRQTILLLEREWSEKSIEVIPDLEDCVVHFDEALLAPVWNNLLSNAIKFTPAGGRIHVYMKQNAQTVTVSVQDNGIGMTEEVRAHIFEKFFQGDPSREKKGYGIGLAIVSRILQLCNGTITVKSEKNQGSTFSVTLPRKN